MAKSSGAMVAAIFFCISSSATCLAITSAGGWIAGHSPLASSVRPSDKVSSKT